MKNFRKGLILFLSPLLMYGESLVIYLRQFERTCRGIAELCKSDAVQGVVTIKSEEQLKKILKKAEAGYMDYYIGKITFDNLTPGTYHLDLSVYGSSFCISKDDVLSYSENITIHEGESKNLDLVLSNLKRGKWSAAGMYARILDKLNIEKKILDLSIDLNAGESYTKNLNVDGKNIDIKINAKNYSRSENASISRGDRLGSNGFYLVRGEPSVEVLFSVDSKSMSESPCYFYGNEMMGKWDYIYDDIYSYYSKIEMAIEPFRLEFYPSLQVRTGMKDKGLLKNHFYFKGVKTSGCLWLFKKEKGSVRVKKEESGRLKVLYNSE
ncbi:MAG: hypothetical protein ACPLXC_00580 [Candidatus Pacearchaeota archaeon]